MIESNLRQTDGRQPPKNFWSRLKYLGPGLIISGAIVGSGELIATTALGAKVGFVALWLILFSCVIKVVVLEELGRYTISSGETTFSQIYTVTLGSGALALFLAGAFALYSSVASLQKL